MALLQLYLVLLTVATYAVFLIPFFARELRYGRTSYTAKAELRLPKNLILIYRSIQVVQIMLNGIFGKFLFPFQSALTLVFVLAAFMMIRIRDKFSGLHIAICTVLMLAAPVIWGLTLILYATVYGFANKILNSWKRANWKSKQERMLMARIRVSCKPIMMCCGSTFVIRKVSILLFLRGLIKGLVKCLLSFRNVS